MSNFQRLEEENDAFEMSEILLEEPDKDRELKEKKKELRCKGSIRKIITEKIPIINWLPNYNVRENLKGDVIAGITVGVMLIPQSMAYALVAGLPPIYGLYSSIVPLLLFGMFTTSRHLAVGPFAIISLLVGEAVSQYLRDDVNDMQKYINATLLLTFLCGVIKIIFGIFRFGFLVNFLSDPVRSGFNSASAIIIGVSQLKHLFGVSIPTETFMWMTIYDIAKEIPKTNGWAFLIGVVGIALLIGLKKLGAKLKITIPGALVVVAIGTLLSWALDLEGKEHVIVVGDVPSGFPPLVNPFTVVPGFWSATTQLLPSALIIVLVTFISALSISTKFADEFKYKVDGNQEFLAMGIADTFGSIFSAYPLAASLSRTAVNVQSGAKTPLAGMISTTLIIVALIFLAPVVYYIPRALLASIVLVAVVDIIDYKRVRELWKTHKRDMSLLLLAFFATLAVGILQGLLIGIGASLFVILYKNAYPPVAELGRLLGSTTYINKKRFPHAVTVPGLVVVRFDSSLYFANVEYVRKRLRRYVLKADPSAPLTKWIIMDCSSMIDIDSTAIRALKEAALELRENNIQLFFACVKGPLRDAIRRCGVVGFVGQDHFFWSVHDAVGQYYLKVLHQTPPSTEGEQKALHDQAMNKDVNITINVIESDTQSTQSNGVDNADINASTSINTTDTSTPIPTTSTLATPTVTMHKSFSSNNLNVDFAKTKIRNRSYNEFPTTPLSPIVEIPTTPTAKIEDLNNQFHATKWNGEGEEYSPFVFDAHECKEGPSSPILPSIEESLSKLPKIHLRLPQLPQLPQRILSPRKSNEKSGSGSEASPIPPRAPEGSPIIPPPRTGSPLPQSTAPKFPLPRKSSLPPL